MAILSRPYGVWKKKKKGEGAAAGQRDDSLHRQVNQVARDWAALKAQDLEMVGKKETTKQESKH